MSVTILEALQNAEHNFNKAAIPMQIEVAKTQLHNAVVLLGKGYGADDEVEPLLEKYGEVEQVPEKQERSTDAD